MCTNVILLLASILLTEAFPIVEDGTVIDQRQSGELNVQVSVKDVEIIALLSAGRDQYTDYDYNYDYSELTIKPPTNSSTALNSNITSHYNSSEVTNQPTAETTTQAIMEITPPKKDPVSTLDAGNSSTVPSTEIIAQVKPSTEGIPAISSTVSPVASSIVGIKIQEPSSTATSAAIEADAGSAEKGCRKGFHRNKKGDCELKIKPNSTNALLKLVELSQKLKLRRAN